MSVSIVSLTPIVREKFAVEALGYQNVGRTLGSIVAPPVWDD